jgi:hypothetical protein
VLLHTITTAIGDQPTARSTGFLFVGHDANDKMK